MEVVALHGKRTVVALLAIAGLMTLPSVASAARGRATLSAKGGVLHWTAVRGASEYELRGTVNVTKEHPVFDVPGASYTPPAYPGHTVTYKVREITPQKSKWSKNVRLAYEGAEESETEETSACDLFASTKGSDSNPGSSTSPFRTVGHLESRLKAGQTGCLASGETFVEKPSLSTSGTAAAPVTITSAVPSNPATIRGVVGDSGSYSTISHIVFRWHDPAPYSCWNSNGFAEANEILSGPGKCASGKQNPAGSAVVVYIEGAHETLAYDDVSSEHTPAICLLTDNSSHALIEHSVVHDCGPAIEASPPGFPTPNEEIGWHMHAIYDYGVDTTIRNDIIYGNSKNGVLFYPSGTGGLAEHNVIDENGSGVWFGSSSNDLAQFNIITNSYNPRSTGFGIGSFESGSGNIARKNCLFGNHSGNVEKSGKFASSEELEANPLYENQAARNYTLSPSSPCVGYGPDTIQP
jgi:hypothetical protein